MPRKPALHLKTEPPSLLIHVPGTPKTGGEQYGPFCDKVSEAIRQAASKAGLRNVDDAVQVSGIFCLNSHVGTPGQLTADPIDIDNMLVPFLSRMKRREGGPLADNASVAAVDGIKIRQHTPGAIIQLRVLKNRRVAGNPLLRARDYSPLLKRYSPYARLKPVLSNDADDVPITLDFMVPGKIFPAGSHDRQMDLFRAHILESAIIAAEYSGFPTRLPRNALIHTTIIFCYSDRVEAGKLKISSPDLVKLLKPTLDALRGKEPGKLMEDDDQVVSLSSLKMSAQHHEAVYVQLRVVTKPEDLKPPEDIPAWMAACDAQQMRLAAFGKPIIIPPYSLLGAKGRRNPKPGQLMEARA